MINNDPVFDDPRPTISDAVAEAIASGAFGPSEAGVTALVRQYAFELDGAAQVEAAFAELWEDNDLSGRDYQRLQLLEQRVRAGTVVANVGPRLLSALESLGLSPLARSKLGKAIVPPTAAPVAGPKSALAALLGEADELAARRKSAGA